MVAAMLGPVRYAAPNASVRARLTHLLPNHIWSQLLSATDLAAVVALLRTTAYATTLQTEPGQSVQQWLEPEQIEQELQTYLVQAFQAPLKLLQGTPRTLLDWLWRRFELENLKTVIRALAGNLPPSDIQTALLPLGHRSDLPWDTLIESSSVPALLRPLRSSFQGQRYAHALEPAIGRYRREGDLFGLEVALDLFYYRHLLHLLDSLSGRDRRDAGRFIDPLIDGYNMLWAFRYHISFDLSPEEIINYTLQRRLRVDAPVVRQIALGMSLQEAARHIWNGRLPHLDRLDNLSPEEALPELELLLRRYRYTLARRSLEGYPFHLGTILAYTVLLESEVQDLTAIVEGKAVGLSREQIRPVLIGSRE